MLPPCCLLLLLIILSLSLSFLASFLWFFFSFSSCGNHEAKSAIKYLSMLSPCCSAVACICLYFAYILYTLAYSSLYYLYNRAAAGEEQEEKEKGDFVCFFSLCLFLLFPSLFLSISLSFSISFYIYFSCFGSFFFSLISVAFSLSFPLSVSLSFLLLPPCCVLAASLLLAGITKRNQQSITCPCSLFAASLLAPCCLRESRSEINLTHISY